MRRNSMFYSRNQLTRFKKIRKHYMAEGKPAWKAEQYAKDHIVWEQRGLSK